MCLNSKDLQGKRHISILSTRDVILWTFFWRPPSSSLGMSRTFLDSARPLRHYLRLSAVYKSINVHLGQGQDLIMSIQIHLKYKCTYKNAGFCILCTDEFKILKFSNRLSKFSMMFTKKRHRHQPSPPRTPQRSYDDISHGQNRYVTLP